MVLAPYSAVLQREARDSLGISLEGAVVVFDEAHNLLDAVNASHSAAITGGVPCGTTVTVRAGGTRWTQWFDLGGRMVQFPLSSWSWCAVGTSDGSIQLLAVLHPAQTTCCDAWHGPCCVSTTLKQL